MERKIPKNVRQIGNVSDNPKIYVEDYVDTFFSHLCEKGEKELVGAFLVGDYVRDEDQDYMFFQGAIQMNHIMKKENQIIIEDKTWRKALKECKEFFEDSTILGWFLCGPDQVMEVNDQIQRLHEKLFLKKSSLFVMRDTVTKEDFFYVYKYNDLLELGGHYIYYEKNPSMQNYMISHRRQNGVTPSESIEDRAAKDFRSIVQEKEEKKKGRTNGRLMYAGSIALILIVVAMGISTMSNYDKMKSVETSLSHISEHNKAEASKQITAEDKTETSELKEETRGIESKTEETEETKEKAEDSSEIESPEQTETPQGDEGIENVYVVESGDTLAIISMRHYGDLSHIDQICKMNGLKNGNLIYEGQKLLLP